MVSRVSVIIPVWNAEAFVRQAVESALALDVVGEVVLVEDGSTDRSLEVCRDLEQDSRVRLLQHPDGGNHGAGASRNLGIRAARFAYIAFLDADDWYLPNRFAVDVPLMESDGSVDGVYGAARFENQGEDVAIPHNEDTLLTLSGDNAPENLFSALLFGGKGFFTTDAVTVRAEAFSRAGLFDETLPLGQDAAMWLKLAGVCRLVGGQRDEPVAVVRRHAANRWRPGNPAWRDANFRVHIAVWRWALGTGLSKKRIAQLRRAAALSLVGRREGLSRSMMLCVILRRLVYSGWRIPALLTELGRVVLLKLVGRSLVPGHEA
ncbi:MAG: glycosyltransferase [Candidatus Pacebacteria bacterium]|nr:glycosyltransferase [Candidatus Paceibacterota bacterium]